MSAVPEASRLDPAVYPHARLRGLIERAQRAGSERRAGGGRPVRVAVVHPCDALAVDAAQRMATLGIAEPVLVGDPDAIRAAGAASDVDAAAFEIVPSGPSGAEAAARATALVHAGGADALMKGSLHTDELMSAVVDRATGLRGERRISHAFLFDLPRYPKLLALADCVVNIAPNLAAKRSILGNAIELLQTLGIAEPKVGVVAAVETVNPAIPATLDAAELARLGREGAWPGAIVDGPFGFDNAISAESARIKKISSPVPGDADLLLMPDLNAGNMLYKSFVYIGGGDCAGLVLGARVPVVLTSRADSLQSRIASVALAGLAARAPA
ncbi:MAG: bifunctional enoyl-CoA hydratase/phosphate acetyltransferase [Proteobacteria bacterium]|nr:bifunctional enoyl-CoA hydratase/phosphate acetyltransferase [Pseudomonadota bacterium]